MEDRRVEGWAAIADILLMAEDTAKKYYGPELREKGIVKHKGPGDWGPVWAWEKELKVWDAERHARMEARRRRRRRKKKKKDT